LKQKNVGNRRVPVKMYKMFEKRQRERKRRENVSMWLLC